MCWVVSRQEDRGKSICEKDLGDEMKVNYI